MGTMIEIDLDRLGYGGEEGTTLGEAIIHEASRRLVHDGELGIEVRDRWRRIADEELRTQIAPLIEKALAESLQPTNSYGERKGEPTTLREVIVERAAKYLREPDPEARSRAGAFGHHPTRVETLIAKEVARTVQQDLKEAMDAARAQVVAGVKDKAAEVIAETIARTVVR